MVRSRGRGNARTGTPARRSDQIRVDQRTAGELHVPCSRQVHPDRHRQGSSDLLHASRRMWAEGADIGGYRTLALRSLRARLDRPGFLAHARKHRRHRHPRPPRQPCGLRAGLWRVPPSAARRDAGELGRGHRGRRQQRARGLRHRPRRGGRQKLVGMAIAAVGGRSRGIRRRHHLDRLRPASPRSKRPSPSPAPSPTSRWSGPSSRRSPTPPSPHPWRPSSWAGATACAGLSLRSWPPLRFTAQPICRSPPISAALATPQCSSPLRWHFTFMLACRGCAHRAPPRVPHTWRRRARLRLASFAPLARRPFDSTEPSSTT